MQRHAWGTVALARRMTLRCVSVRFATDVPTEKLRNFGISAHVDSGKTTLTERILFYTGKIEKMHEVNGKDGVGAVMDSMKQERERGITIKSAATFSMWKDCWYNIIDTPGHIDFTVEVERSLRVLDGAVLVVCAVGGVQSQTLTVDRQMKRYGVPRIIFINKLDRKEAVSVNGTVADLGKKLGLNAALIQLPHGYGKDPLGVQGVVDVITQKLLTFEGPAGIDVKESEVPAELRAEAAEKRAELIEILADLDEGIAEKFLNDEDPTEEEIHAAIRKGVVERTFAPVLVGAAKSNVGCQPLLDAINRYLPHPGEIVNKGIVINDDVESHVVLENDEKKDLVAMAFKLEVRGTKLLTYIRVYQGVLKKGDTVRLAPRGSSNWKDAKTGKITRLVRVHSATEEPVDKIRCGEICAVEGLDCSSGDTLVNASQKTLVSCESIFVPDPVISIQVHPRSQMQMQDLIAHLKKFEREDPTFRMGVDPETKDLSMSGMGELHLDIFVQRLQEAGIEVTTGQPFVQFREYLPIETETFDHRHKRQSGGRGQFAQLSGVLSRLPISLSSKDNAPKTEFANDIVGGILPENYVKSIQKAFNEMMANGPLLGVQVWGLKCSLTGGMTHEVDSSDFAFNIATKDMIREKFEKSGLLLEPVMNVEVVVPNASTSEIVGMLTTRMGDVKELKQGVVETTVTADVPLRRMFGFISDLRGCTKGLGDFTMEYSHHIEVPQYESATIIEDRKAELAKRA
ncbi:Elongation factor G [Diplonema papillatum]|nr:Elongation factor G [Diplonema papillatum]